MMNRALALLPLLLALARTADLRAVTLAWNPPPEPVAGYALHWGANRGTYTQRTNVGNATQWPLRDDALFPGTNYFICTAYDEAGLESDPSNELAWLNPSWQVVLTLEAADNPAGPWTASLTLTNNVPRGANQFFRGTVRIGP